MLNSCPLGPVKDIFGLPHSGTLFKYQSLRIPVIEHPNRLSKVTKLSYKNYRLSADTSEEAEAIMFELLSKKTFAEKWEMVSDMNKTVRLLAFAGLRDKYPDENENQLRIRFAELFYGEEIASRIAEHFGCRLTR